MQLHFLPEELNLLADILLNQGDPAGLLDRVMARDIRFDLDELDQLREILVSNKRSIGDESASCQDPRTRSSLQNRQLLLESMIEKVSEACAML
jgi:hypothetical protein